ncbi:MAG: hypothetical protein IJH86_09970 [Clostridia bacterium]|nr:hypothetical protein [Clostridia bacterium]
MINISKRALALLIALLLALPIPAFAEDVADAPADAADAIIDAATDEAPDDDADAIMDAATDEAPGDAANAIMDAATDEAPGDTGDASNTPDTDTDADTDTNTDTDPEEAPAPVFEIPVTDPFEPEVEEGPELELGEAGAADGGEQSSDPPGADDLTGAYDLPTVELPAEAVVSGAGEDDDAEELLDAYVQRMIDESLGIAAPPLFAASASLTGNDGIVCDMLKSEVARVAEGDRSDTVFVLTEETLSAAGFYLGPWTSADLGMSTVVSGKQGLSINSDAVQAISAATSVSTDRINQALLADCPSELYWYDKTSGMLMNRPKLKVGAKWNGTEYALYYTTPFSLTFSMPVSAGYQGADEYTVDAARITAAKEALARARAIVENHSDLGVRDRLAAYKNEICERVDYNHDAANNGLPYGDPWQLIYVFDDDPATKVVCEGYSKAFKYLFDLSGFGDCYDCLLAVGTMNGLGHMWNIVHMDDDRNYLVDVTNCDSSSGPTDRLFMSYGPSGSLDEGYTFTPGGSSITYKYSDKARITFSDAQLTFEYNPVRIREGIAHGALSADAAEAYPGKTVGVTVTPDAGYALVEGSLIYRYDDGAAQSRAIGSSRSFSMPAAPVTVEAEFQPIPDPPSGDTAEAPAPAEAEPAAVQSESAPAGPAITIPKAPAKVKAKAAKKGKVTVSWKKIKKTKKTKALLKQIKGIEVQISTDPTFTTDVQTKNLGKKKTKFVFKKLQKNTVYYARVRYTDGAGGVSKWSATKKVKTKKK